MINFDIIDYDVISSSQMPTETMQELADACGVKAAILLMEHFGGRALAVPSKRKTELYDEIVIKCGEIAANTIFQTFSGESINIPMRREALRLIIHQLTIDSNMIDYLIYAYGTTRSTIYRMMQARPRVISKDGKRFTFATIEDFL